MRELRGVAVIVVVGVIGPVTVAVHVHGNDTVGVIAPREHLHGEDVLEPLDFSMRMTCSASSFRKLSLTD